MKFSFPFFGIDKKISLNRQALLLFTTFFMCAANTDLEARVVTTGSHHLFVGYGFLRTFHPTHPGVYFGPISANYQYALGNRITIGGGLGYASEKSNTYSRMIAPNTYIDDSYGHSVYMSNFRSDYHYLKNEKLDIYSGLSLFCSVERGWYASNPSKPWVITEFYLSIHAVACRYMFTPRIGAYGEISIWGRAVATLGVSARLGKSVED